MAGEFTQIAAIVQRCLSITFGIPANRREMQTQGHERGAVRGVQGGLFGAAGKLCAE